MHANSPSQRQDPGLRHYALQEKGHQAQEVHTVEMLVLRSSCEGQNTLYLEEVLEVMGRKLLHLGCIVGKAVDLILSKGSNETESRTMQVPRKLVSDAPRSRSQQVPLIKFINMFRRVDGEDANNMSKQCLPDSEFNLVQ